MAPRTGHLDAPVLDTLRALRAAYPDARISLIGAAALAFHIAMTWRHTSDIDLVLTIRLDDLEAAEKKLSGWRRLRPPKWLAPNGVRVDIVPAPPDALAKRELVWSDGSRMSLAGVAVALANTSRFVSRELDITVAPVPILALLKMAAYLDRPERGKDLGDLAHILYEYPPNDDDRFYEDAIFDAGLTEEQARGTILGRELAALIDDDDRAVVTAFVTKMRDDSPDWSRFVSASPWKHDEDRLRVHFDAFRDTFEATAARRGSQ